MNKLRILFEQAEEGEEESGPDVGKVFVIKKLYSELISLDSFLRNCQDSNLSSIRFMNSEALELFELVIKNMDTYKDQIDDIIYLFYKYIEKICSVLQKHFKNQKKDQKNANKRIYQRK